MLKKKIVYVVNSSAFFISHFLPLAKHNAQKGYEIFLVFGDSTNNSSSELTGFTIHNYSMSRSGKNPFIELVAVFKLIKIFKNIKPDLIHAFTIKPILHCGFINLMPFSFSPKSIIYSVTGLGSSYLDKSFMGKIIWFNVKLLYISLFKPSNTHVLFENDDDIELFTKNGALKKSKASIINGAGVDTSKFIPKGNSASQFSHKIKVAMVSRLLIDKGVMDFIEAAKLLKAMDSNVEMLLVGDIDTGNISSVKLPVIKKLHDNEIINYLGFCEDIPSLYKEIDIACLPSYQEGLPKSLIEAMSCGLPIIATDVPGCRQLVNDGENGLLVNVRDPNDLANKIHSLTSNDRLVEEMGIKSRQLAIKNFDLQIVLKQFDNVYNQQIKAIL